MVTDVETHSIQKEICRWIETSIAFWILTFLATWSSPNLCCLSGNNFLKFWIVIIWPVVCVQCNLRLATTQRRWTITMITASRGGEHSNMKMTYECDHRVSRCQLQLKKGVFRWQIYQKGGLSVTLQKQALFAKN